MMAEAPSDGHFPQHYGNALPVTHSKRLALTSLENSISYLNLSYRVCFKMMSCFSVTVCRERLAAATMKDCTNSSCAHPLYKVQKEPSSHYSVQILWTTVASFMLNCMPSRLIFVLFYPLKMRDSAGHFLSTTPSISEK